MERPTSRQWSPGRTGTSPNPSQPDRTARGVRGEWGRRRTPDRRSLWRTGWPAILSPRTGSRTDMARTRVSSTCGPSVTGRVRNRGRGDRCDPTERRSTVMSEVRWTEIRGDGRRLAENLTFANTHTPKSREAQESPPPKNQERRARSSRWTSPRKMDRGSQADDTITVSEVHRSSTTLNQYIFFPVGWARPTIFVFSCRVGFSLPPPQRRQAEAYPTRREGRFVRS